MSEMMPETPPVETPAEPAAEEAWSPSREEWDQVVNGLGYLASQVTPAPEPETRTPERATFDPFAEDADDRLRNIIREEMAPVAAYQQYEQQAEAEERAYDILDDISSRLGEIDNKEQAFPMIRAWADTKMPEMAQKYGFGPRAAEAALEQSYHDFQAFVQAYGQTAVERHMNQLTNLGGARTEPAFTNGSVETTEIPGGGDELSVVQRFGGMVAGR